jgi:hypothetical protein
MEKLNSTHMDNSHMILPGKFSGIFQKNSPGDTSGKNREVSPASTLEAEQSIRKARALLHTHNNKNTQAVNLIQMAETALKNGNAASAKDFAGKVLTLLIVKDPVSSPLPFAGKSMPGDTGDENGKIPGKKIPRPPVFGGEKQKNPRDKEKTTRTYQDVSNDPGVSFSYPGKLTGPQSFFAVRAHEYEHVRNSIGKAVLNGEKVMVMVRYKVRFDPATGEPYMAGGVTRTIHYPAPPAPEKGKHINTLA